VDFAWQKGLIDQNVYVRASASAFFLRLVPKVTLLPLSASYAKLSIPAGQPGSCASGRTKVGDRVRKVDTEDCRTAWRLYDLATAGIGDSVWDAVLLRSAIVLESPLN